MKAKHFLPVLFFLTFFVVSGQTPFNCIVEEFKTENINSLAANNQDYYSGSVDPAYLASFEPISFNIFFWEINRSDGSNDDPLSIELIEENLQRVNELFKPMGICFVLKGFDKINNDNIYENAAFYTIRSYAEANNKVIPNSFNVYIPKNMSAGNGATNLGSNKLAVSKSHFIGMWEIVPGNVLAHELGHDFDLYHPWGGQNGTTVTQEHVIRDITDANYNASVLGTNTPKGDKIHDTPAMVSFWTEANAYNLTIQDIINTENCNYTGPGTDNLGIPYDLSPEDVGNPMAYTWSPCIENFSTGQGIQIREYIDAHPNDLAVQALIDEDVTLDLYVKDSYDDFGEEPNPTDSNMWTSPDIWIRNSDDNGMEHQNPEYKINHAPNYIYVRVVNRGCDSSTGNEKVIINWAKANTALGWPEYWDGTINNGSVPMGGEIAFTANIPILEPREEAIVKIPWVVPNPYDYGNNENPWHFCLIARIEAASDPFSYPYTTNPNEMVRNNNNMAWKNMTVVDLVNDLAPGGAVAVSNIYNQAKKYKLKFSLDPYENGKPLFEEAEITVEMDSVIFDAWVAGGKKTSNVKITREENKIMIGGDNASLDNLILPPNAYGSIYLSFNFLTKEITDKIKYTYHVTQEDNLSGELIGGETYIVKKHNRPLFSADAGENNQVNEHETIVISAEDISEPAIYNWYDSNGNLIFTGKDLTVSTDVSEKYKLEIIAVSDGFKDYHEVDITLKTSHLENITPNPSSNNINVSYKLNGVGSAYLMILGYYGSNTSNNHILDSNSSQINIDISDYQQGFYTVSLVCDGEIVDSKTLIKE